MRIPRPPGPPAPRPPGPPGSDPPARPAGGAAAVVAPGGAEAASFSACFGERNHLRHLLGQFFQTGVVADSQDHRLLSIEVADTKNFFSAIDRRHGGSDGSERARQHFFGDHLRTVGVFLAAGARLIANLNFGECRNLRICELH
jgi:hypothetical protein